MTPGSKGLVGIIANDAARFSAFAASVTQLKLPPKWDIEWVIGGDWCAGRNALAQFTLDNGYSHLWFMDDDHVFRPDLLTRLLGHGLPLVSPLCTTRTWPFTPVAYLEGGVLDLKTIPRDHLARLHAGGTAGMLISRTVLEAIEPPWFIYGDVSEDVLFCEKARDAGFELILDPDALLHHVTSAFVGMAYDEAQGWVTEVIIGGHGGARVTLPTCDVMMNENLRSFSAPSVEGMAAGDDTPAEAESTSVDEAPPPSPAEGVPAEEHSGSDAAPAAHACLICGAEATWQDVHGQRGCGDHPPESEAWLTYWERAEIWLDEDDNRWHFRVLRGDKSIGYRSERSYTTEAAVLEVIDGSFPGLDVHLVLSERADSYGGGRSGLPAHLWNRRPTGGLTHPPEEE